MSIKWCPRCQQSFMFDDSCEDVIHQCFVSETLANEDIKVIGNWDYDKKVYSRTTHNEVTSEGTLLEDFENLSDWTVGGTGATQELSTLVKNGSYSLRINTTGGNSGFSTKTISNDFSDVTNFILWVYLEKGTDDGFTGNLAFYISSSTTLASYFLVTIDDTRLIQGWNRIVIDKSVFTASGGESWSNTMVRLRVRVNLGTGESCFICFDDLRYDYNARPKVIICFDDGWDSVYTKAYPVMKSNNQKGVSFLITDNVDTTNYMELYQVNELYNIGWDISNHTKSHQNLSTISASEMHNEINVADIYLKNYVSKKFLAYPFGDYNDAVINYLKTTGFGFGRTIVSAQYQPHINLSDDIEYQIKCITITNTTTTSTVQGYIDQLINQKGLLILLFHIIVDSDADVSTKYLTADFQTISDYIKTKVDDDLLDVITFSEYYDGYTDITGTYGVKPKQEVVMQGVNNKAFGTRTQVEGGKIIDRTVRGNNVEVFRIRKHEEFIKLK